MTHDTPHDADDEPDGAGDGTDTGAATDRDRKRSAADSFGANAAAYLDSAVHRTGDDLDRLAGWCESADRALDVATGAGHTAGRLVDAGVDRVVATDAAPTMVATAETEFPAVEGTVADAERLPFDADTFDAVTCRIAAHHFPNPRAFLREVARVIEPGGTFAFEDNVAPDDGALDDFLNRVERTRDPTHVRSHRVGEWTEWLDAAGFTVETTLVTTKTLDFEAWLGNVDASADRRRRVEAAFADRPDGATDAFEVVEGVDGVESFANLKLLARATR